MTKSDQQICGTCRYHLPDDVFPSDWVCVNNNSKNCGDWTEFEETCESWEERRKRYDDKNTSDRRTGKREV